MLSLDSKNQSRIVKIDLERAHIVNDWEDRIPSDTVPESLSPTSKYAGMSDKPDFFLLGEDTVMHMDPRQKKLVAAKKRYSTSTRVNFSAFSTTGAGFVASGSKSGDIRLFDKIGKNAKTYLPGIGDFINGIDVSNDGFYVLATTLEYLLLIDTRVRDEAKGGFEKSMGKSKPQPIKLAITPEDRARYQMGNLAFTTAHFDTGIPERKIVTSSGPFLVTWNFAAFKLGEKDAYQVKKLDNSIVADQFVHGDDGKIVVALPEFVALHSFTTNRPDGRTRSWWW